MSQNTCIQTSRFGIGGETLFPGTAFQFEIQFASPELMAFDVLACEWFLDGILVDSINSLEFTGQGYCGDHIVAVRILTADGWSGLKTMAFANCKSILASQIDWPTSLKEGSSSPFNVFRTFTDGTKFDISASCTFTVSDGGYFEGNILHVDYSPSLAPVKMVEVTAHTADGEVLGPKQVAITNIDKPVIFIEDFDYMVVRYSWQHGTTLGLDVAVGFENTDSDVNNQYVGYGQLGASVPFGRNLQDAYLYWPNDNTKDSGEESVLINLKKFTQDFAANDIKGDFSYIDFARSDFSVDDVKNLGDIGLYAIWRGKSGQSELFKVQVTTYKGGTMQLQGSQFVNQTGVMLYNDEYTFSTKRTNSNQLDAYYRLGKLRFNKATKRSTIELYDGVSN